jgi:hypothetical protein
LFYNNYLIFLAIGLQDLGMILNGIIDAGNQGI